MSNTKFLRDWQRLTVILLFVGYAGYYACRSNLSVCTPLLIKEFGPLGLDKKALGAIVTWGTLAYAFGKFANGSIADFLGGRKSFLFGMGGAILSTLVFAFGGFPFFTLAWVLNRLIQSAGWVGMVKITSRWFSFSQYGAAMGVISLSYLFGDFFSRLFLGQLIIMGWGWRGVFYVAAGSLAVFFLTNLLLLKESPQDVGEDEPAAHPNNLFGESGHDTNQTNLRDLLAPLLRSTLFWTVCALSFGFTLLRETFNTWIPQYLTEVARMREGDAAQASALFPLVGGFSVLLAGFAGDRLGRGGRAAILFFGLILAIPALVGLSSVQLSGSPLPAILALGSIAFVLIGPYSFLAGAISLDFGGKRGSATVCGWIDGIGYLGGVLAGKGIGAIAQDYSWSRAFLVLAGVAGASSLAAGYYWYRQRKPVLLREAVVRAHSSIKIKSEGT